MRTQMGKKAANLQGKNLKYRRADGFSLTELLIVIATIGIVCSFAVINFYTSTRNLKLAGATRNLATYLEKARIDSICRHGGATVTLDSATSYTVNIDFNGTGVSTARTITLPQGVTLTYRLPPAATNIDPASTPITIGYDWRGRAASTTVLTLTDSAANVGADTLVEGAAGDISVDTTVTGPVAVPSPQTNVPATNGIKDMN